ncbi:uncharacterized protein LOC109831013 [Asparagus officinalis]|uniref:uncharacterized protein LOC109831013 n=1 Tax=Asparagus officinalis TaxID=4686 RepID=UPI00098E1502|nr:uncharacterized protein LOC109831013 [Asparagus officinalis]
MIDCELMSYFLGIEVHQQLFVIFISQMKYAKKILEKFKINSRSLVNRPIVTSLKFYKEGDDRVVETTLYRSLVGSLRYLTISRPDIIYGVGLIWIFDIHIPLDIQRIWKRNLGRDDRCISDHGKKARFPFLDEDVIKSLLELPLWEIVELDEPAGRGDKKILREVARLLGIEGTSLLPKRAIQFGSRIARESNRKTFGSNRAANQASAGSVEIWEK